jgi:putative transposase
MTAQLVCDALKMAILQRRPKAGLIVHSDRGSQYATNAYRRVLKAHDFFGSMSRKGNCWDNSAAESFFGSLKQERVQWRNYQTRNEAKQDVMNYITMWYNSLRLHSYLSYKSPNQFEIGMQVPLLELQKPLNWVVLKSLTTSETYWLGHIHKAIYSPLNLNLVLADFR